MSENQIAAEDLLISRIADFAGPDALAEVPASAERIRKIRETILQHGLSSVLVGRVAGRNETFRSYFARTFGVEL